MITLCLLFPCLILCFRLFFMKLIIITRSWFRGTVYTFLRVSLSYKVILMSLSSGHNISIQSQSDVITKSENTAIIVGNKKFRKNLSNRNGNIGFTYKTLYIFPRYLNVLSLDIKIKTQNIYDGFDFDYSLNYILVVVGLIKLFIALRVILMRQAYMSPRCSFFIILAHRLCRMYGS